MYARATSIGRPAARWRILSPRSTSATRAGYVRAPWRQVSRTVMQDRLDSRHPGALAALVVGLLAGSVALAQTPAPQTPASQTPAPQTPAPQTPAPQTQASQTPASQTPAAQAPSTKAPAASGAKTTTARGKSTRPPSRYRPDRFAGRAGSYYRLVWRSEEHTSELQSLTNLVCRLLLEKKKKTRV